MAIDFALRIRIRTRTRTRAFVVRKLSLSHFPNDLKLYHFDRNLGFLLKQDGLSPSKAKPINYLSGYSYTPISVDPT
jgi:hypothetical protein